MTPRRLHEPITRMSTIARYRLPILMLILLLAFVGRLLNIDHESLWVDEGFSYWAIRHDDMLGLIVDDVHPPLYFVLLRGWAEVAGITELALRYFSVLPSLLSVAMMVPLAREVQRLRGADDETVVPLLAALMLALADMESYIAQQTRNYALHVLWVIVSMWAFLRWCRLFSQATTRVQAGHISPPTGHLPALGLWVVSTIALLYTHYIGAAAVAMQGAFALVFLRGSARRVALAVLTLLGMIFGPWLLLIASGQTENVGTGFNVPSTLESLWNWRIEWFTQQWPLTLALALLGLVLFVYSKTPDSTEIRWRQPVGASFLLLGCIVVPVAGAYVLNHYTPILMDYRLTQITPPIALLIALGLGNLRPATQVFLVAVIVAYGVAVYDTPRPRPPWRDVGMNAAQYAEPGDLALAHVEPSGDWQVMYYYERFMSDVERRSIRQWKLEQPETYAAGLPALLDQHNSIWYMHWSSDLAVFDRLRESGHVPTARIVEDWLGNDLAVYRFDRVPAEDEAIATYAEGPMLRDVTIIPGDLRVDLWWSTSQPLARDYTVSVILLDDTGRVVAQYDAPPFNGDRPTTSFAVDEVIYDPHPLALVDGFESLPPGDYVVGVKLYYFEADQIIDVQTASGDAFADVATLTLEESTSPPERN